jgi:hypothetical protein
LHGSFHAGEMSVSFGLLANPFSKLREMRSLFIFIFNTKDLLPSSVKSTHLFFDVLPWL